MTPVKTFIIVVAVIVLIFLGSSLYTVRQGKEALLIRLGKITLNSEQQTNIKMPGLHFKFPFIDKVVAFDVRVQTYSATSERIQIKGDTFITTTFYVKWKINDIAKFYKAVMTQYGGLNTEFVKTIINGAMQTSFGNYGLQAIISQTDPKIMGKVRNIASEQLDKDFGVKIVDLRITQIDLPPPVLSKLYSNMIERWKNISNRNIANGKREAKSIRSQTDAERIEIIAKAELVAQRSIAKGVSTSAKIYADAYNKDPDFYSFYRSLLAYKDIFNNNKNILVLRPDGDFFKFFNHLEGSSNKNKAG